MYCTMLFIIVVMELVINGSSLRIEPFRFLKENSVYVYQQSKYIADRIALERHELKLTVFAFVFCIYAVRIYRAMNSKVSSIICLRYRHKEFSLSLFQLSDAKYTV